MRTNTNSWELKVDWKKLGGHSQKLGVTTWSGFSVSQVGINGINWFLACWFKFRKAKSHYFNNFCVVMVKNGHGQFGYGTLKSDLLQQQINELSWFFACWHKFRKAKSYFHNYWVGMVKKGDDTFGHETQNQKWNWANWLNIFCMLIVMQ